MDLRNRIKESFKNVDINELEQSIDNSIKQNNDIVLPSLGIFFEIIWNNCSDEVKNSILDTLVNNI